MRFPFRSAISLLLLAAGLPFRSSADDIRADLVGSLSREERRRLVELRSLSASSLEAMNQAADVEAYRKDVETWFAATEFGLSRRGEQVQAPADLIRAHLSGLEGVQVLGELKERIPVPVTFRESALVAGESRIPLSPFWTNGALPNAAPVEGLTGTLVDVGDGEWEDLKGKDPRGAIVLMNYTGGRNWNRVFSLGAQAVVVLEDDTVSRTQAERFFAATPLPVPRFLARMQEAEALRALVGQEVRLEGGNALENRTARSVFAWLPPHPVQTRVIGEGDLLERIAAQFGLQASDLVDENQLSSPVLSPGQELLVPGREKPYTVGEDDLLKRLSREFDIPVEALVEANEGVDRGLTPGTELSIPALQDPLVLLVRTDAVSSVPELPHGAGVAANLVAGLRVLEEAVRMPEGARRRGVLVAFLDGDAHGGMATRRLLETWMRDQEKLGGALISAGEGGDEDEVFAYYEFLEAWWETGETPADQEGALLWLVDSWLYTKLEAYRVALAEARAEADQARYETDGNVEAAEARAKALQDEVDRLVAFRKETLSNKQISLAERATLFMDGLDETLGGVELEASISREELRNQFLAELTEERELRSLEAENRTAVIEILKVLYSEERPLSLDNPLLGLWLDLSDGSPGLTLDSPIDYRNLSPVKRKIHTALLSRMDKVYAFASLQAGWAGDWRFVGPGVEALFPRIPRTPPPSYQSFWAQLGIGVLDLRTVNDDRSRVDTHLDVPAALNMEALSDQLRSALLLTRVAMESPQDGGLGGSLSPLGFSRLVGMTTQFNPRSGIDAKDPVPGSLVMLPSISTKLSDALGHYNTSTYFGNRIPTLRFSRLNGRFAMPLEALKYRGMKTVHAYRADPDTGLFEYVLDGGQIGTQRQTQTFSYVEGRDTWKNLILYPLYPMVINTGVEPLQYQEPKAATLPQVQDAVRKGVPQHVQMEHPLAQYGERELGGLILYMEPGRRMVMFDKRQGAIRGLLLGELDPDDPTSLSGRGLQIGPTDTSRNLTVPLAALEVAKSLQAVNDRREAIYSQYGIRDTGLFEALEMSRNKIAEAEAWVEQRDWQRATGSAREGWGLLIKNYPGMLKLGREAVLSVVLLMALMAPTSVFLERLTIGSKSIIARLGYAVLLFGIGTVFLNFFHPAFQIAANPIIVVIAFAMILMSVVVLSICYQRFEVLVRRARIEGGEAESEEISLASTLSTAFNLGVSNLKKRPTRTLLTGFTVTVLTFSIVTFVSVKGTDTLFLRPVPMDLRVQGVEQPEEEILPPEYEGVLFREYSWATVSGTFMDAVQTEFGSRYALARRIHYIEAAGGNNATKEGKNQIEVRLPGKGSAIVTALMGFEPVETEFSGLHRAVSYEQWFQEGDRHHILLPERVAEALGITGEELVDAEGNRRPDAELPEVLMMSQTWKVIGILDTDKADRIRDVNGKSPALVDYLRSAITPSTGSGRLETEDDLVHMSWEDLAIVPVAARQDIRGGWNSLAVKFPEEFDFEAFRNELARRLDRAMFAHVDGELSLLSARKEQSIGGLAKVLVPILLCVLIVSNTMMGTVDERVGEVQMLGAIGLSPSQISFLLLAESTVFSCIGIIFGTYAGLLFSKVAGFFPDSLGQLSFNFTSLASTFLAMGTGGIVLLATLLPARKAAALAAPSGMDKWQLPDPEGDGRIHFELPFTLTRGNAVGMGAFFRRFLLNHVDSSSADFISKGTQLRRAEEQDALDVSCHMWLAPYDLDVAQDLQLEISPTGNEGVFGVTIHLHRISGSEDAWLRTNYAFLNLVRKQFLLWRNLEPSLRKRYIHEGSETLDAGAPR